MSNSLRGSKKILPGLAILVGVFALLGGVYGFWHNLHCYFFKTDCFVLWGFIVSIGLAVVGTLSIYIGTKFIDRSRPTIENAWITGIMFISIALICSIIDVAMERFESDPSEIALNIGALIVGTSLLWVSRRKRQIN